MDSLLQSKVSELVVSGVIPGNSDYDTLNQRVLAIWVSCHGTNYSGEVVQNVSYDGYIQDHSDKIYANTQDILRIINDVYNKRQDGSTVDFSNPKFAEKSDTGVTSDLSSAFTGSTRDTLVKAINYTYSLIDARNTLIGSGVLKTNATTLVSAINEIMDSKATNTSVADLSTTLSQLATQVTSMSTIMPGTSYSYSSIADKTIENENDISSLESRVSNIENLDGSESLNTNKKTLTGGINEVKSDIEFLKSNIGKLSSISSSLASTSIVDAINNISSKLSDIESRLSDLESNA